MTTLLFDHPQIRTNLLPFTFTRPVAEVRVGIFTITEKWSKYLPYKIGWLTQDYLSSKYQPVRDNDTVLFINGALCPDKEIAEAVKMLGEDETLVFEDMLLAVKSKHFDPDKLTDVNGYKFTTYQNKTTIIRNVLDIYSENRSQILADIKLLDNNISHRIKDPHSIVYNEDNIYVEEGADIKAAVLNAENGPIYIGKDAVISEGAVVRGPFALCEHSAVNMGSKIRGDSTVGPYSKVGGEIGNSVIFGYSNKAHDGYLGNSVIGEWCNLGADTNTSNLKNNYKKIKLWNYSSESFVDTGLQFCGLMMGDHAKCGINTMFNTGTVVGVGANVFGAGFLRNYIPSFSWGGVSHGLTTFRLDKFFEMTDVVMQRRNKVLNDSEMKILSHIFDLTSKYRSWEKTNT